jgi:methyl-accepting chemotaxis protein
MSIKYKLLIAFSVTVLLATAVAVYGIHVVSNASTLVVRLYDGPLIAVSHARSAQSHFNQARHEMERGMVLRDATSAATLARIEDAMKQFIADLSIVRERMSGAGANGEIDRVKSLGEDWFRMGLSHLKPPAGGVVQLPVPSVVFAKGNDVTNAIDVLVEAASAHGFDFRSQAEAEASASKTNLIVLVSLAAAAGMLLAFGIAHSFTRPIRYAMAISERIAGGTFDAKISTTRRDELGRLLSSMDRTQSALRAMHEAKERDRAEQLAVLRAQVEEERQRNVETQVKVAEEQTRVVRLLAEGLSTVSSGDLTFRLTDGFTDAYRQIKDDFNTTIGQLHDTIVAIAVSTHDVAHTAREISGSTADLAQRTEEQTATLEEVSASMQAIAETVKKNADDAQQANEFATGTHEIANRGGAVVSQAVSAMARIEESSRKISDIIGVIDEIARQTNLLALNAAVEAARAGEAGRGFAVVASEVRSLAQRSAQAAKDIKDLITNSSGQVREGVELVNRAGGSLSEILASIRKVAEIVSAIASASGEQSSGVDHVNTALSQMDETTQQNAALVEENAAAAQALEQQALAMDERVTFFRLADERPSGDAAPPVPAARRPSGQSARRQLPEAPERRLVAAAGGRGGF